MDIINQFNPDGSILRNQQLRMLKILEYVDDVCRRHEIKYWLSSGTLLGAVRHKGFIPWDDDLDIEMLREDYLRLIKILKKERSEEFVLQINSTDRNYVAPYAKLRERTSIITEIEDKDKNYKYRGIFIDIFPLEKTNVRLLKLAEKIQNRVYFLSTIKNDRFGTKKVLMNILFFMANKLIYPFLRLLSMSIDRDVHYQTFGTGFYAPRFLRDIFPLKEVAFEGKYFPGPRNADAYLTLLYGDYMKMPDLSTIQNHISKIEFSTDL